MTKNSFVAEVTFKGSDYCCIISLISKNEDIEKVLVSDKISFGEKNYKDFIGYLYDNHKVKPLHIMLPKTTAYVKSYDVQTKWIYFLIEDDD